MRERCAELFDSMAKVNGSVRVAPRDGAKAIRALPLPPEANESDGQ